MSVEYWLTNPVTRRIEASPNRNIAVDVGANVGSWCEFLSAYYSLIIAVEPDTRASDLIKIKENIQLVPKAINNYSGTCPIFLRPEPDQNSLLEVHPIGNNVSRDLPPIGSRQIECITLDDLCPSGADFVKIDIEGAEILALEGCKDQERWMHSVFVVECHNTYRKVHEHLLRLRKEIRVIKHPLFGAHPGHCWMIGVPSR